MAYALLQKHVRVDGIVLISGGLGTGTRLSRCADACGPVGGGYGDDGTLPRPKLRPRGQSIEAACRTVTQWATAACAPALAHPESLTDEERRSALAQLSSHIGVPTGAIDARTSPSARATSAAAC
ncbi:MAG: hypothetical protein U1F35_05685 [Steroidobacteraceae bacterium]